jgi:choline dehydrogenase-like flavoprotein
MSPDIVIIGSGMGGATLAAGLAGSGARILILEKGSQLLDSPETRDPRAIFEHAYFRRNNELWRDGHDGATFLPGNHYYVGGNSKFYGAVLIRFRAEDFLDMEHEGGLSPAWPYSYGEIEPFYSRAEALYRVRGELGDDPTEPFHSAPYPFPAIPDEPALADVRSRLSSIGLHPSALPLGVDRDAWLTRAPTPWDCYPDTRTGKMDAETCALDKALKDPDIRLETDAEVRRLLAGKDGRIEAVEYRQQGEIKRVTPKAVVVSAGAIRSAALLLASRDDAHPAGLANRSDVVGRNFMNHNSTAMIALSPRFRNDAVHQKTFGLNDFYLADGKGRPPLGNIQLFGRVSGAVMKSVAKRTPLAILNLMSRHAVDFLAQGEDLPNPESRIRLDGEQVVLHWQRSNMVAHQRLVREMKDRFRAIGFPFVLTWLIDRTTTSHQCGTIRMGNDPATSALDSYCRAHDHRNLFVVDASFMPSSAGVNPALTIAAQALRVADHMLATKFAS